MKKYIIPICLGVLLSSCSWLDKEDDKSVIEGHFYKNCNLEPITNKTFTVTMRKTTSLITTDDINKGVITTDANGYFKLEYEPENSRTIDFKDGGSYTVAGVLHENHVYVDFIQKNQCTHKIILLVNNSLSKQDTLYLGATGNGEVVILSGPFYNNQSFNISIRPNIGSNGYTRSSVVGRGILWWGLGWAEYKDVQHSPQSEFRSSQLLEYETGPTQPACGQGSDVYIDLRGK